jgi:hypothetical protein
MKCATLVEFLVPAFFFSLLMVLSWQLPFRTHVTSSLNLEQVKNPNAIDWSIDNGLACGRQWSKSGKNENFGTRQMIGFTYADPSLRNLTQRWLEFTRKSLLAGVFPPPYSGYTGVLNTGSSCCGNNCGSNNPGPVSLCAGFIACDSISRRDGAIFLLHLLHSSCLFGFFLF